MSSAHPARVDVKNRSTKSHQSSACHSPRRCRNVGASARRLGTYRHTPRSSLRLFHRLSFQGFQYSKFSIFPSEINLATIDTVVRNQILKETISLTQEVRGNCCTISLFPTTFSSEELRIQKWKHLKQYYIGL